MWGPGDSAGCSTAPVPLCHPSSSSPGGGGGPGAGLACSLLLLSLLPTEDPTADQTCRPARPHQVPSAGRAGRGQGAGAMAALWLKTAGGVEGPMTGVTWKVTLQGPECGGGCCLAGRCQAGALASTSEWAGHARGRVSRELASWSPEQVELRGGRARRPGSALADLPWPGEVDGACAEAPAPAWLARRGLRGEPAGGRPLKTPQGGPGTGVFPLRPGRAWRTGRWSS